MRINNFIFKRTNENQGEVYFISNIRKHETLKVITYDCSNNLNYVINSDLDGMLVKMIGQALDAIEACYDPGKEINAFIKIGCVVNEEERTGMVCLLKGFIFDRNAEHYRVIMSNGDYSCIDLDGFMEEMRIRHECEFKTSGNMVIAINNDYNIA